MLWDQGTLIDLGDLGGGVSFPEALNEGGQAVGSSRLPSGFRHGFLWDHGALIDLGSLGGVNSTARGLNDLGHAVGPSRTIDGDEHAFLWRDGTMLDLGTLGGSFSIAESINNDGWIVGGAETAAGETHAALWRLLTPEDMIEGCIGQVEALVADGVLNQGQGNSLINKLNIATAMLNDGKTGPAVNKLEAFQHEADGLSSGNNPVLTPEQGQALIDCVQGAINELSA